jgi:hypothetical protein
MLVAIKVARKNAAGPAVGTLLDVFESDTWDKAFELAKKTCRQTYAKQGPVGFHPQGSGWLVSTPGHEQLMIDAFHPKVTSDHL